MCARAGGALDRGMAVNRVLGVYTKKAGRLSGFGQGRALSVRVRASFVFCALRFAPRPSLAAVGAAASVRLSAPC